MSRASDASLGDLHGEVARVLREELTSPEVETQEQDGLSVTIVRDGKRKLSAVALAITFLKNNGITADADENAALNELKQSLAARRTRRGVPKAVLEQAAHDFSSDLARDIAGGLIQ